MVSYKSAQDKNLSLLCYPILMAADIMIHNVTQVPVGEDQRQHLELYEKLRNKVNRRLEDKKVDLYIRRLDMKRIKHRIMDLVNPKIKMSKSNMNESGIIYIDDDPLIIRNKIRQGLSSSDPLSKDHRDESIKNLLTIALLFWPEGYVYLSNLTGKKHFLFKAMLGLGISFKISRLWGFISKVSTGKIDDYCNKGLRRSRELSEPVLLKLNLL